MDFLTDWLTNWLKELLIGGIMGNLEGLFDTVNTQVGEIAAQVGTTPAAWHAGVFSLIRQLSETVILPIAGMVLTFVATYELIQMLLEKNNISYAVTVLQRHLGVAVDGNFGAGTKAKLIEYQKAHGLTADGICGSATWSSFK